MPERGAEAQDHSDEIFTASLEDIPGPAPVPERGHDADVIDFAEAAEKRAAARENIEQLAEPAAAAPEDRQTISEDRTADVVPIHRGSHLIEPWEDSKGRDRLTEIRPQANALLGRMVQDKTFAKEIMRKKDLGTNYSAQGISEAMAAAALPYARRAMRAAKRGNRYERMDLYKQASSDAANAVGRDMDLENVKQASYASGKRFQEMNMAGRPVDYQPRKKPINFLARRGLPGRFGIHLPAMRRFK
jgi:hypothetical protein